MRPSDPDPAAGGGEVLALIHHHPGRLRVRAEAFRIGDAAARVASALDAVPGITSVAHNARTGSVLVEYQAGLADPETILERIAQTAGLAMPSEDARARRREPALFAIDATLEVNELVHEITGYRTDLRSMVPAALVALGAWSFVVHKDTRLPRWDNLLYWSYNIFSQLHRREIEAATGYRTPARVAARDLRPDAEDQTFDVDPPAEDIEAPPDSGP